MHINVNPPRLAVSQKRSLFVTPGRHEDPVDAFLKNERKQAAPK